MSESRARKPGFLNIKTGDIHKQWTLWKQKLEIYIDGFDGIELSSKGRWSMLISHGVHAGDDVLELYISFSDSLLTRTTVPGAEGEEDQIIEVDNRKNYEAVVAKIDEYTLENKSVTSCR